MTLRGLNFFYIVAVVTVVIDRLIDLIAIFNSNECIWKIVFFFF